MLSKAIEQLVSVHLIEKEIYNDIIWRWSYPNINDDLRNYIEKHSSLENDDNNFDSFPKFRYYHHNEQWIYISTCETFTAQSVLPHVKQFAVIIIGKDFNPEKYDIFTKILSRMYRKTGNFSKILSVYLSVMIEGSCNTEENGTFMYHEFEQTKIMASQSHIKSIIKMFGLDIILIYTALILKKRIAVYHHKLETLLQFVRSLPAFVWHRQNWDQILFPVIELTSRDELEELKSLDHYVAGFLDSDIENRADLYDVCVNLAAVEITVAHDSKDHFSMTKTHKDIAVFMFRQSENTSSSDIDVIKEICAKTKELIKTLKSLGSEEQSGHGSSKNIVTLNAIKEKKLSPALETFLWNLAIAENMTLNTI